MNLLVQSPGQSVAGVHTDPQHDIANCKEVSPTKSVSSFGDLECGRSASPQSDNPDGNMLLSKIDLEIAEAEEQAAEDDDIE